MRVRERFRECDVGREIEVGRGGGREKEGIEGKEIYIADSDYHTSF